MDATTRRATIEDLQADAPVQITNLAVAVAVQSVLDRNPRRPSSTPGVRP